MLLDKLKLRLRCLELGTAFASIFQIGWLKLPFWALNQSLLALPVRKSVVCAWQVEDLFHDRR